VYFCDSNFSLKSFFLQQKKHIMQSNKEIYHNLLFIEEIYEKND